MAVLLFFAPRSPRSEGDKGSKDPLDARIDEAVSIVENGERPMEGIMKLQGIAEEYPDEPAVQWHLGRFSVRSGQYEKAKERFEKLIEIAPQTYEDAYLYLGKTLATLGDTAGAVENLRTYRDRVKSDSLREQVSGLLRSLNGQSKKKNSTEQKILNDAKR